MGLDITAYRKIALINNAYYSDGEVFDKSTDKLIEYDLLAFVNEDFPGREDDLQDKKAYTAQDKFSFRAGSYGGYNRWRDCLAKLAGWPLGSYELYGSKNESYSASAWEASEGPFWEIINFSDCEGVIGPITSKKLFGDFSQFEDAASRSSEIGFYQTYLNFKRAFEMASDSGAVRFA